MNINLTLFIQVAVFLSLVWGIMRYAWPQFENALDDRAAKISKSLADAERAEHRLKEVEASAQKHLKLAKEERKEIIARAHDESVRIVEKAKEEAQLKAQQMLDTVKNEIELQKASVKKELMQEVSDYALRIVGKVLDNKVDTKVNEAMILKAMTEEKEC